MPKLEVTIQPAVLDWIMQQSSADEAVFPDIVDTLQAWRTGTAKPTFHKVEEISKKTRIPFGYFFMARPPVETNPLAEYRTIGRAARRIRPANPVLQPPPFFSSSEEVFFISFNGIPEDGRGRLRSPEPSEGV